MKHFDKRDLRKAVEYIVGLFGEGIRPRKGRLILERMHEQGTEDYDLYATGALVPQRDQWISRIVKRYRIELLKWHTENNPEPDGSRRVWVGVQMRITWSMGNLWKTTKVHPTIMAMLYRNRDTGQWLTEDELQALRAASLPEDGIRAPKPFREKDRERFRKMKEGIEDDREFGFEERIREIRRRGTGRGSIGKSDPKRKASLWEKWQWRKPLREGGGQ